MYNQLLVSFNIFISFNGLSVNASESIDSICSQLVKSKYSILLFANEIISYSSYTIGEYNNLLFDYL